MKKTTEFWARYELLPPGSHVLCALSGGRDSVYLLYLLLDCARERRLTISAAHLNHHLRGAESDRDELFVRDMCSRLQVPLTVGHGNVSDYAAEHGMGMEEAARTVRYAFLERTRRKLGADVIATAHHADDLAETMLLQLARGAGTKGLSGIPPRRGAIVRPLLLTTRAEIEQFIHERAIPFVEDSTNAEEICSRNMLRHRVMPLLRELNPSFVRHAAQAALLLREDDECLQEQADMFLRQYPAEQGIPGAVLKTLPWAVSSRIIRSVWGNGLTAGHVQQILDLCGSTALSYAEVPGTVVRYDRGRLWTDQPVSLPDTTLDGETGELIWGAVKIRWNHSEYTGEIHNSFNTFVLKCENMKDTVTVTSRREGDRVKLMGSPHTKRLKQLFQEHKLTQPQRAAVPVFRDDRGIAAIYGFGTAQRCQPKIGEKIICIRCEKYRENGE